MNKELEALNILRDNHIQFTKEKYAKIDEQKLQNIINRKLARWNIIEKALNELEDLRHNYNALEEFYNNAVAYSAKIQKELNELKKRNEPMKPIILTELEQVRPFKQTYKTAMCGNCKNQLSYIDKPRHCPECGQNQDWSDEK